MAGCSPDSSKEQSLLSRVLDVPTMGGCFWNQPVCGSSFNSCFSGLRRTVSDSRSEKKLVQLMSWCQRQRNLNLLGKEESCCLFGMPQTSPDGDLTHPPSNAAGSELSQRRRTRLKNATGLQTLRCMSPWSCKDSQVLQDGYRRTNAMSGNGRQSTAALRVDG